MQVSGFKGKAGAWPPTACPNLQIGHSFSAFTWLFFAFSLSSYYPSLSRAAALPFHPHSFEAPDTYTLAPTGLPFTHPLAPTLPRAEAHEEFVECPQETLPWSKPHSSFNTGRKIKGKKKKQPRVWRREGGRVRQNRSLLPCLTRHPSDCQTALIQCSHRKRMSPCGEVWRKWGLTRSGVTMRRSCGLSHACSYTASIPDEAGAF